MEKPLTPEERFALALGEHVGVQKPYCLIRRSDKEMLSPRSFNMEFNRIVNNIGGLKGYKDDAAGYAIASPALNIVQTICYRPDGPAIIDRKFNMWSDPGITPLKGEPKIFLEHIAYLIPNESERRLLLSWLAWIVQHPDQKVQYAILIVGRGGTGKSWLGKLMERIFGADNVVLISEEDVVTSTFNGFSENKRLVFLHETPPKQMADLLDKVKGLITDRDIHINRKGIERYKAENFANLMAISNEDVKINLTNRRWAVIRAADDPVGLNDRGRPTPAHAAYYKRLWDVVPNDGTVTDEVRSVLHYLRTLDLVALKFDAMVAPLTGAKEEASEAGEDGRLQARIAQAYKNREGPFRFNLLTAEDVAKHVHASADKTLTTIMLDVGCRKLRRADGRDVQVTLRDGRPRLWAANKAIAEHHTNTDPAELVSLYYAERAGKSADKPHPPPEREPWDIVDDFASDFEPGDDATTIH
jgi:hypothetical protein